VQSPPRCTRRLCPRPMIVPSCTRTDPIGMPPSASPASASAIAASRNASIAHLLRTGADDVRASSTLAPRP
jgi:hypothetical protein